MLVTLAHSCAGAACYSSSILVLHCRFDASGEGACLKRYTDPSFFRAHSARLEQGTLRVRANRGPYLKSMSMVLKSNPILALTQLFTLSSI